MTQIVLQTATSTQKIVLIELQGSLESTAAEVAGMVIGAIQHKDNGAVELIIGQHKLTGRLVKLAKPLAVVYKSPNQPTPTPQTSHTPLVAPRDDKKRENTSLLHSMLTPKKQRNTKFETSSPNLSSDVFSSLSKVYEKQEVFYYEIMQVVSEKYVFDKRPEHFASEGYVNITLNKK